MRHRLQVVLAALLVVSLSVCARTDDCVMTEFVEICPLVDSPGRRQYEPYVLDALREADVSVDLVLSSAQWDDVDLWSEVIAAHDRGADVRVLLDCSDWAPAITERNRPVLEALRQAGIDARFDSPEITTHAKLLVIDRQTAIIGSSNWNAHALEQQWQAGVAIVGSSVAASFTGYVDRLWEDTLCAAGVSAPSPVPRQDTPALVPLPDTDASTNYASWVVPYLTTAERSIHVVMYRVAHYPGFADSVSNHIIDALIRAAARGVDVRVIFDDCAPYPESARANLEAAILLALSGVDVRLDQPGATTHAKLAIVDERHVFVGSTNWNYYALERNNEAAIALLNIPSVAAEFERFFTMAWTSGSPVR